MDKNGRLVTRHVRTSPSTIAGKSMPVPSLGSDRYSRSADILTMARLNKGVTRRKAEERLMNMEPETFQLLEKLVKGEKYEGGEVSYRYFIEDLLTKAPEDKLDSYIRNSLAFEEDVDYIRDMRIQQSLHVIPEFADHAHDLGSNPDLLAKARNLTCFVDDLNLNGPHKAIKETPSVIRLKSRKLEKMLIENLSNIDEFMSWASDHGESSSLLVDSCDCEMMLLVLEHPDKRDELASLIINDGIANRYDLISLMLLERPDDKEKIREYLSDGIDRVEVINGLLDKTVQPSLSSGVL